VVEETTGARRADRVHAEVGYYTIPDNDNLAILPPDFDDGLALGEVVQGAYGVAGNLVLDQVGADDNPGKVAGAAGGGYTADIMPGGSCSLICLKPCCVVSIGLP